MGNLKITKEKERELRLRIIPIVEEIAVSSEVDVISAASLRETDERISRSTRQNELARNKSYEAAASLYTGS